MCWLKDAKVWIPDASVVWKCASLLEDYKGQQQALRVCYEDGTVSAYNTFIFIFSSHYIIQYNIQTKSVIS